MTALEAPDRMEPARIDNPGGELLDLSLEVVAKAELLGRALHPETAGQLARTVRIMNTYYSNLIEGHNTRPREIEQALAGIEPGDDRRDLKIEAVAHYRVQQNIDERAAAGTGASSDSWPQGRLLESGAKPLTTPARLVGQRMRMKRTVRNQEMPTGAATAANGRLPEVPVILLPQLVELPVASRPTPVSALVPDAKQLTVSS